jgi:xanthine/uracil permease
VQGPDLYERMQGGILGDALGSIFSALGTSLPNTTFSQNNGVISLTRVASRQVRFTKS